ncbi:MAG: hypothetical protein IPL19_17035 [Sandaracinaceae bacterium]|jgi:hypothetical protein|nr:hypothetical protein [Sandaracinaceae bacterium]MBK7777471.1 hypothetical protein [Sandaracinaceae bacterium]MBK8409673.1 hypothetical protein [Sandaracinaceae bacterium]
MTEPAWGPSFEGIRFGLEPVAPGAPLQIPLHVENHGRVAVRVFGFATGYPRSLRISPPKPHRPYVRVSFADTNLLHPPDAFMKLVIGARLTTMLDVSFALDLASMGPLDLCFAYDEVEAQMVTPWNAPKGVEALTGMITLRPA